MSSPFLRRLREKIIIADGAMGTMIQNRYLTPDDFRGLDGCNEYLCLTKPDLISDIHARYLEAGADLIETNSFGTIQFVLDEYGIGSQTKEIGFAAARLARTVADDFSQKSFPRFVAGSIGPGTKLPTLGHIAFADLHAAYLPGMIGLLEGGVDLFQIETCQDLLQIKCAVIAARDAMKQVGREVPIVVTFTVETTGTMLVGAEVAAALAVLESLPIDLIGLNCATGPDLMQENVRFLCQSSSRPVAVLPNAGLPRNVGGQAVYDLTPEALVEYHELFVKDFGAAFVGGCCGTTPDHIKLLAEKIGGLSPRRPSGRFAPHVASTFAAVPLDQDNSALLIGERCNANGSKAFREKLLAEDWEGIIEMAREEVAEGSHVLDVCTAYVGRDEVRDMREIVRRAVGRVTAPLMIDSTQLDVLEAALQLIGGRAIINSINFEDGEGKFDKVAALAARYGAALVALTIDEEGMAKTAERKLAVAKRMVARCQERHGIPPEAILIDPLTFTIGSGDEESRRAGIETLQGIASIKRELPGVRTLLGLSNISFGLKSYPRQILNSVFFDEARKAGLDAAIVHVKKITPLASLPGELITVARDLIYDARREGYDPLFTFIEKLQGASAPNASPTDESFRPIEEVLRRRIIEGRKNGIEEPLTRALEKYPPLEIINQILLDGMREVGDLFGSGQMQLPFVLQSAETMKKAVAFLQPFMEKKAGPAKGSIVLATVKGDVHDIGKNLVDIILSNNGYVVHNLGIKQPIESILEAVEREKPTAIGLSGLLVKSTVIMKENLEYLTKKGHSIPVICGGAALNRAYVEVDLRAAYETGPVYYGADAFTGLRIMDELTGQVSERVATAPPQEGVVRRGEMRVEREARVEQASREVVQHDLPILSDVPTPPFWGVQQVALSDDELRDLFRYINKRALYANQWQYRRGALSTRDYKAFLRDHVEPLFHTWCERAVERRWLAPRVSYGYFPANSEGNTLIVYDPIDHQRERQRFEFPRQIADRRRCISDYFLPVSAGKRDVVAFHVVTVGEIASEKAQELFRANEYTDYLHFYGLSVEIAEAFAEYWHKRVRHELGIAYDDGLTIDALQRQTYRGERFSFGYPACPRLEDQQKLVSLLELEKIGVTLTSECQLVPEQSTSAIICHHPDAAYFSI